MNAERERAQPCLGADIARRFLSAGLLLRVDKVSTKPRLAAASPSPAKRPGFAGHILTGGEQADIRSAELQPDDDRLAFADDDVRPPSPPAP